MEMKASRQLSATRQQAWDALNDPEVLKLCIPGCTHIESTAPNEYNIATALKVGPVSAKFTGAITLSDINPPESYTLNFEGKGGAAGFGKGTANVSLAPNDAGCELHYSVHATVGGKIAQLGQRLIDGTAKSMADDFFKRFDNQMQERHGTASTGTPNDAAPDTTNDTTNDTAPPATATPAPPRPAKTSLPRWVWVAVAAAAIVVLFSAGTT